MRIFTTTTGRLTQSLPHPRPVSALAWRRSDSASAGRDDLVPLYTTTADAVLRIFIPVLDSLQYLQLHGAVDVPFSRSEFKGKGKGVAGAEGASSVFWLDRTVLRDAFRAALAAPDEGDEDADTERRRRRAREVVEEGWDLFLRIMHDGSVLVTAIAVRSLPPLLLPHYYHSCAPLT